MQEVLIAQKENAFLSQKLASIVTDLDVSRLPEAPFAPGILSSDYIELLKKYEFRSLIPTAHLPPQKEQIQVQSDTIDTLAGLEKLQLLIGENISKNSSLIISTNPYGKIVIGYLEKIYSIDSKKVDCSEFISYILDSDIEIV